MFNSKKISSTLTDILYDGPEIRDARGALTFVQDIGFPVMRAFWIYDVPEDSERGGHAHRTCTELLFAVKGSFDVELSFGDETINVHLERPNRGVFIRPMVWCRLHNFSADFVGLCLASQEYSPEGYINSKDEFLAETHS